MEFDLVHVGDHLVDPQGRTYPVTAKTPDLIYVVKVPFSRGHWAEVHAGLNNWVGWRYLSQYPDHMRYPDGI